MHRCRNIAFDMPNIAIFGYPSCVQPPDDVVVISDLFAVSDQSLFKLVLVNDLHVLQPLLPDKTNFSYNLRSRHHNRQLVRKTTYVNNSNFIIRMQYSNSYLLMLTSLPCYSILCTEVAFCQPLLYEYMIYDNYMKIQQRVCLRRILFIS